MSAATKSAISSFFGLIGFALLIFVPAGTIRYWQGWVFLGIFTVVSTVPAVILNRVDPAAIERRRKAGPKAETRRVQKVVMTAITASFAAVLVLSGLDYRFGWSRVPTAVSIAGDVMVAVGLGASLLVVFQNRYAAATITVEDGQPVVRTGLYRVVRHPMYAVSIVMMIGMPLALGSYWALLIVVAGMALLIVRILDEEAMLCEQLPGYQEYLRQVRYRLVPGVW